jgi:NAD-dependent DNA ligase
MAKRSSIVNLLNILPLSRCDTTLVRNEEYYYCQFYGCSTNGGRIQHFISRKAMDIEGLGGKRCIRKRLGS